MINQKITLTDPLEENYFYKEAMKTLRTNLQFSGKNYKTIVVTSTQPGEGKSNICFHLAVEMAKTGKKVLLVDDIYTTGSTVNAIAGKLKQQGVKEVYFLTLCIGNGM